MKKFVNDPRQFVPEMLTGIELASGGTLKYEPKYNLIYRADIPRTTRSRSSRDPGRDTSQPTRWPSDRECSTAPARGTSSPARPSSSSTRPASCSTPPKGILHIVNNYTGDRTAWEMAKEMCEAEGMKVGALLVNDDVAVKDSTYTVGRRGVAGNFFVIKATGAASDNGAELDELVRIGEKVIDNVRTMGIALSSCTPPVRGTPLFEIGDDEMEIGIGIHGEPGRERTKLASADEIVDILLDAVIPDLPFESGDEIALMVNGLGGTPISELYLMYGLAHKRLADRGISVFRSYVGEYCTSLEMAGAHLTALKVDDELKELLLAPAEIANRIF